jgi:histidinol dehydrogenase
MVKMVRSWDEDFETFLRGLGKRGELGGPEVKEKVQRILQELKNGGREALLFWARKLDKFPEDRDSLELHPDEWEKVISQLPPRYMEAMERASVRIRKFHEATIPKSWLTLDSEGCILGHLVRPLERVGIYAPGGKAAYPSSVLMTAIPAKVAGVEELVMCSPMSPLDPNPAVLAAAKLAGVDRVFAIGGVQAIGAMAYGIGEVPKVDKIVGPGNVFVAEAKRAVFGEVDIDMFAGPSEVLIVADGSAPASFAAWDMLSQAEHDEMASAILVTPSEPYALEVERELEVHLRGAKRRGIAEESLRRYGAIIVCRNMEEALEIASRVAPEHLELLMERPMEILSKVRNAGAVFLGMWSTEPFGDYVAGPSHVLPTGGTARFASPLGVEDFLKRTSVIGLDREGVLELGGDVISLAELEGLEAHARAVRVRLDSPAKRGRMEKK